jgi:hypothetical protein
VVLIGVHHGFSVRYLLQTDILPTLLARGARVVIVAEESGAYLRPYEGRPGVTVEVVPRAECERYFRSSRLQAVLRQLRHFLYGRPISTGEILWGIAVRESLAATRGWRRLARRVRLLGYRAAVRVLERSRALRRALLRAECRMFTPSLYDAVLDRHRPDVVVVSSLGTFDYDQYLMRAARRRGIPVASVVLSWDNTTTRGYPGAIPDEVVTWTDIMRREVAELHDLPAERAAPAGVAHFDPYWRADTEYDRDAFLRELGADPRKRIVFVATRSPNSYPYNPNIAELLAEAVRRGDLPDTQLVVRVHPLHYRRQGSGRFAYQDVLDAFARIAAAYPREMVLNVPVFDPEGLDFAMPESEMRLLARLLRAADVIVTVFSTINIEGAIFDKPLVNVCFEDLPAHYDVAWRARFDVIADSQVVHNRRVVETGGVALVRSPEEMVRKVAEYLADPARDAEGRRRIVADEAGPNHGRSGVAVAERLLALAAARRPSRAA